MEKESEEERRVSGRDLSLHDQGAVCKDAKADETKRQSCHREQTGSQQLRIRLPHAQAVRLLGMTPHEREQVMMLLCSEGVDLAKAGELVEELRRVRLAIINALRQAQSIGAAVDAALLEDAISRVTTAIGGVA